MRRLILPALAGAALSLCFLQCPCLVGLFAADAEAAPLNVREWVDPTEDQIKDMTSSDFWYWVQVCSDANRTDVLTMLTKTMWEDEERKEYVEQIWSAIYTKMTGAEAELKADAGNSDAKTRLGKNMDYLKFYAPVITAVTGSDNREKQITEYAKLDPKTREQKSWAIGRFHSAEHAIEYEKDYNSALARVEAGWTIIEKLGDKHWMHKFLGLMGECYLNLKKTADAFEKLTAAHKLAEEIGDAEDAKHYAEEIEKVKSSGGPVKKSELDKPESWDKEWKTYTLNPGGGMGAKAPPARTPSPHVRNNSFFWSRLYLADDRKGQGGVLRAEKLPVPGDAWVVKTEGDHEATLTDDPKRGGGTKFKAAAAGTMQRVNATYAPLKTGGTPVTLPYYFQVAAPNEVRIYNQKLTVNNPKNILDLRVRPMTWRQGKGPEGQKITIIDGNFNAQFGTVWKSAMGKQYEDVGMDGFHTGRGVGTFFSTVQKIGKNFYQLDPQKNSVKIDARKFIGKTGMVKVNVNLGKARPTWLIVSMPYTFRRGNKEENTEALINIADAAGKPMELPAGGWKLYYGLFADGKSEDKSNRIEMRPGNAKSFEIKEGETTEINIGGTLTPVVPAAYAPGTNEVVIDTEKIEFHGEHGEIYHHLWPNIFSYQATAMASDGRPVTKAAKARAYTEQEVKPSHDALAFAAVIKEKPIRKPEGKLWVKVVGAHKMLGKLSCTKDPSAGE